MQSFKKQHVRHRSPIPYPRSAYHGQYTHGFSNNAITTPEHQTTQTMDSQLDFSVTSYWVGFDAKETEYPYELRPHEKHTGNTFEVMPGPGP